MFYKKITDMLIVGMVMCALVTLLHRRARDGNYSPCVTIRYISQTRDWIELLQVHSISLGVIDILVDMDVYNLANDNVPAPLAFLVYKRMNMLNFTLKVHSALGYSRRCNLRKTNINSRNLRTYTGHMHQKQQPYPATGISSFKIPSLTAVLSSRSSQTHQHLEGTIR